MPSDSSIKVSQEGEQTIIKLNGALDSQLANNLHAIVPKVSPPIVLDLANTSYITADGLQALFDFYQEHKTAPELIGAHKTHYNLMRLTGLSRYFIVDETALADDDRI